MALRVGQRVSLIGNADSVGKIVRIYDGGFAVVRWGSTGGMPKTSVEGLDSLTNASAAPARVTVQRKPNRPYDDRDFMAPELLASRTSREVKRLKSPQSRVKPAGWCRLCNGPHVYKHGRP